jgi:hypothetical protein
MSRVYGLQGKGYKEHGRNGTRHLTALGLILLTYSSLTLTVDACTAPLILMGRTSHSERPHNCINHNAHTPVE